MKKILFLGVVVLLFATTSAFAESNVLDGQLVRKCLISEEVKALMGKTDAGEALPVRIVFQSEVDGTFQPFYPAEENFVVVNRVNLENNNGILVATVLLNINGSKNVQQVFVKNGIKAPWTLQPAI